MKALEEESMDSQDYLKNWMTVEQFKGLLLREITLKMKRWKNLPNIQIAKIINLLLL